MAASEHILLESDERKVPHPRCSRKVHARIELRSRLRRRSLQLELIDYYYLIVRSYRSSTVAAEYTLDLRFADTTLASSKHFASRWFLAALALLVLTGAIAFRLSESAASNAWLVACGVVAALAIGATVVFLYRTTETVAMYSVHGRARLFEFTSGFGAQKGFRVFTTKLAAHIRIAIAARRPMKTEHLRDEMREHFRLRESGVLSLEEYEASKMRILAEHPTSSGPSDGMTHGERRAAQLAPDMQGGWY